MSDWNEKLQPQATVPQHRRARRWLLKHCTWKDGTPAYAVLLRDEVGVLSVRLQRMGAPTYWRRVLSEGKDVLLEECTEAEAQKP